MLVTIVEVVVIRVVVISAAVGATSVDVVAVLDEEGIGKDVEEDVDKDTEEDIEAEVEGMEAVEDVATGDMNVNDDIEKVAAEAVTVGGVAVIVRTTVEGESSSVKVMVESKVDSLVSVTGGMVMVSDSTTVCVAAAMPLDPPSTATTEYVGLARATIRLSRGLRANGSALLAAIIERRESALDEENLMAKEGLGYEADSAVVWSNRPEDQRPRASCDAATG